MYEATFEAQFMKKLSNNEAELKKCCLRAYENVYDNALNPLI